MGKMLYNNIKEGIIMRLDKLLANLGYGSRNDIKKYVKEGLVFVNGNKIKDSSILIDEENDEIIFGEEKVYYNSNLTIMINKPKGYLSSNKDEQYPSVLNLIDLKYRRQNLDIAGRLDQDTTGLLLLTNNGKLNHEITSPKKDVYKKYLVEVELDIDGKFQDDITKPMALIDKNGEYYITQKALFEYVDKRHFYLSIKEGKYHQVKNMVLKLNNSVVALKRVQIGSLKLDLEEGDYRVLSPQEIGMIFDE